ncbi:MAG: DUF4349 domain-containing protein [Bradymonadaceae bacterium]|nr:DUF4349 domain-containing protein [Lujinxingiaceae bacterium]
MPRFLTGRRLATALLALLLAMPACGASRSDYAPSSSSSYAEERAPQGRSAAYADSDEYSPSPQSQPAAESTGSSSSSWSWFSFGGDDVEGSKVSPDGSAPREQAPVAKSGGTENRAQSGAEPGDAAKPEPQAPSSKGRPLLIYNGSLIVAIYEVAETQLKAIAIVEEADGFIASRASDRLVMRVPAAQFREILDRLANLGDVIDVNWRAQDVSEEVRDLQIRLQNSMEIRNRLQVLLARAEKVEDALAIEAQLERVTLDIERIIGQLRSFQDRVAFSTIDMHFRAKRVDEIPDDEYLLPYSWLNGLGVDNLLRIPGGRR